MTRPTVYQTHACPKCVREEAFTTKVVLGDYSEMAVSKCEACGHELSETEEQEMTQEAEYDAPELYAADAGEARAARREP